MSFDTHIRCIWMMISTAMLLAISPISGTNYFVDNIDGNDSRSGTLADSSWQSLTKVSNALLLPGDTVNFRRGSVWNGTLTIMRAGSASQPIVFMAYDTGAAPHIQRPGVQWAHAIHITGSNIVVQDFYLSQTHEAGVFIAAGAHHNIVRNNEITSCGTGVMCNGKYNLVSRNYAHDLTMIHDDSGGDDDYGAVAFWFNEGCNEVSYNRGIRCSAHSYDYGTDGGFVEVFNHGDSMYVHHNWAEQTDGFFELGASQTGSARDVVVAYNVMWDAPSGAVLCLHDNGTFTITITNFRFENNTFIQTSSGYRIFACLTDHSVLRVRNNIFYSRIQIANSAPGVHTNNLYQMAGAPIGYTLGSEEQAANPQFMDSSAGDFHLQYGSPAIDTGLDLGYTTDLDSASVPVGTWPDLGAYEYGYARVVENVPDIGSSGLSCFPNPFNPKINIAVIGQPATTSKAMAVTIHDIHGRLVTVLRTGEWDASGYPSGIYIAKAIVNGTAVTRRITLMK